MARNRRGRKALYEVMTQARRKSSLGKTLEQLRPAQPKKDEPAPPPQKPSTALPQGAAKWWRRPKQVQINAGRIEISIPYQLAIAILLGLVVLVLLAFRLGQFSRTAANSAARIQRQEQPNSAGRDSAGATPPPAATDNKGPGPEKVEPVAATGNNGIVIQTFQVRSHLEPVRLYFAQAGIETEIRQIGDMYYLVTKNKYGNPQVQGTDGYLARQRIIQLGANYKAPPGYETFAPNLFKDAYGMKFDD